MHTARKLTIPVLVILAVISFGLLTFSHKQADVDLWGNLGFVKSLPSSESFHRSNTFSFTEPDHEWVNHEWLAEYILNFVFRIGGTRLLLVIKTLMGLLLTAFLYFALCRLSTSPCLRFFFLALVISVIGYGFSTRPHLFTYLMLTSLLLALRTRSKWLTYLALPAGILWANLHGAFFIAIVVCLAYLVGLLLDKTQRNRKQECVRLGLAVVLFFVGTIVNPYGPGIWSFIAESASKSRTYLSEWAPFHPLRNLTDHTDFVALVILCAASAIMAGRRQSKPWLVIGILAFSAALLMRRNIPLFAIVSVFAFTPQVDRLCGRQVEAFVSRQRLGLRTGLLAAAILISSVFIFNNHRPTRLQIEIDPARFPVGSMQFIKQNELKGNVLAFFDWAEYCIWELYPDSRVFLDGRYKSAYSTDTIDTFFGFIYGEDEWAKAIEEFPTTIVLVHQGNPAYDNMLSRKDWTLVCKDSISGLFLKNESFRNFLDSMDAIPETPTVKAPVIFN